jgi:hypothetical protein
MHSQFFKAPITYQQSQKIARALFVASELTTVVKKLVVRLKSTRLLLDKIYESGGKNGSLRILSKMLQVISQSAQNESRDMSNSIKVQKLFLG